MQPGATPVELSELTAHLAAQGIARQKWPEELRIVTDFSRTASGKIRKVDLRRWLREPNSNESTSDEPTREH